MADLSQLSDAELKALYAQPAARAPSEMSDAELKAAYATPSVTKDIAKSAGVGIGKGVIGLAGLPGDLAELGARGLDRAVQFLGGERRPEPAKSLSSLITDSSKPQSKYADRPPTYGSGDITKAVEGVTGEFYKPQTTLGKYSETVGEFAPGLIGGGGAGAIARRAITHVAAPGLGSEAAGQIAEGSAAEPYARIAGALAGGLAPTAIGRAVTPLPASAARQALVDTLNAEGVTGLTAGQRTGREGLRYAESSLGNSLGAGSATNEITRAGQEQFTQAALRRAGAVGENAGPETLANNQARLGNEFQTLSARNTLQMDPQFGQDIGAALRTYDRVGPSQQRAIVQGYADDIIAHAQASGTMPGPQYQEMRSRLSRQANGLRQTDPTLSETLRDMRDALDDAMRRSISPADREAWDTARREYSAQKIIEKTASKAGETTAEGQLVPANLRNVVASGKNAGAYARGEGQFAELARAGAGIMGGMPQSGTAPRAAIHAIASLLGGGMGAVGGAGVGSGLGAVAGAVAGPALAGRALMSRPVQGYLGNQVATNALRNLNPREAAVVSALIAAQQQRAIGPPGQGVLP